MSLALSLALISQSNLAHPFLSFQSMHGNVTLTIYQDQNLALVEDQRVVDLTRGTYELPIKGISDLLIPSSVQIADFNNESDLVISEQRYESFHSSVDKIIRGYINEEIVVTSADGSRTTTGILLNTEPALLLRDDRDQVHMIKDVSSYTFPKFEFEEPTLTWNVVSQLQGATQIGLSYLTEGINWKTSYNATLDADEKRLNLESWVTVSNGTGLDYQLPQLNLVAGEINRVHRGFVAMDQTSAAESAFRGGEVPVSDSFEYHVYSLPRPALLPNRQSVQLAFLSRDNIPVTKRYRYEANQGNGVRVYLDFMNQGNDAEPLPAGIVSIYQDGAQGLLFLGEDLISNTPVAEIVELYAGVAFDIITERVSLENQKLGDRFFRETIRISFRNQKDEPVTIEVREKAFGDWEIIESNVQHEKIDSETIGFTVTLGANSTSRIDYTVEYEF
jgi:hypothetical protein